MNFNENACIPVIQFGKLSGLSIGMSGVQFLTCMSVGGKARVRVLVCVSHNWVSKYYNQI